MKDKFAGILGGITLLVIVVTIYLFLKRFGLIGSKPTEAEEIFEDNIADVMNAEKFMKETNYLNPEFWKNRTFLQLTNNELQDLSTRIYDAWSFWGDDEAAIYSVFESLKSGEQLSQLADSYSKMYGSSLRGKLFDKLDGNEIYQIYLIIKSY